MNSSPEYGSAQEGKGIAGAVEAKELRQRFICEVFCYRGERKISRKARAYWYRACIHKSDSEIAELLRCEEEYVKVLRHRGKKELLRRIRKWWQ